ncbi:hypothetical protein ACETU7_04345 [Rhodococcus sp. 3Y1]
MTYAELDRRSNQLARAMIRRGAGPETSVAIGIEGPSNPYSRCGRWPRPAQRSSPSTPPIRLTESNTCSATPRCCSG